MGTYIFFYGLAMQTEGKSRKKVDKAASKAKKYTYVKNNILCPLNTGYSYHDFLKPESIDVRAISFFHLTVKNRDNYNQGKPKEQSRLTVLVNKVPAKIMKQKNRRVKIKMQALKNLRKQRTALHTPYKSLSYKRLLRFHTKTLIGSDYWGIYRSENDNQSFIDQCNESNKSDDSPVNNKRKGANAGKKSVNFNTVDDHYSNEYGYGYYSYGYDYEYGYSNDDSKAGSGKAADADIKNKNEYSMKYEYSYEYDYDY